MTGSDWEFLRAMATAFGFFAALYLLWLLAQGLVVSDPDPEPPRFKIPWDWIVLIGCWVPALLLAFRSL